MDQKIIYGLIGGLIGVVLVLILSNYSVNTRNYPMMRMIGMSAGAQHMMGADGVGGQNMMQEMMHSGNDMSMENMVDSLKTLKDDEFDRTFIELMIEHHQGAIDMANLIPSRTDRPELIKLGQDIVLAQSREIKMMQEWLRVWFTE